MNFTTIHTLLTECMAFLKSTGGAYENPSETLEMVILDCLISNQYFVKRNRDNQIVTALFYWRVHPEDVAIVTMKGTPTDRYTGEVLYLADMGNKGTRKDAIDAVRAVKQRHQFTGIFCHRRGKARFKMQQKGA